ncbi:hypothetical protein [Colwellia hornerae]|uniref:Lipoprotein n=1 Tax=Colwellia hornerae TaxID=89402 RepID=A0A5C6QJ86_9GAMM|nr:hypothetical protein [Colwellia hornerae]TWX53373.1 hypothetical protein ESZ28_10000 [Colwellia hornerae]TWX60193.1 hypothetical protein ESZ26_08775 [Colwellia hornerae]TWX69014.1 hypothetical protein ESZ27_06655 [Colwellia hornerae]
MSRMKKSFLPVICWVASSVIMSACSSLPVYQNLSSDAVVVNAKKNSPELAQEFMVDIGDNLLTKVSGSYLEYKTQSVSLLTKIKFIYDEQPGLGKGKTTLLGMSTTGGNAACFNDAEYGDSLVKFCLFDEDKDGYFERGTFTGDESASLNIPYNIFSDNSKKPEKGYFRKTLSYKGLSNGKINFNYSEYSGNMVKATFSQEFSIENKPGAHILFNFKGAEIKIKQATLLNVSYEVMQHFN